METAMNKSISRRTWMLGVPGITLASGVLLGIPTVHAHADDAALSDKSSLWPGFPRQDANLVRDVVGASHGREARVRELVGAKPALVNAWWDWGFGDWESPLGAASHTGQRGIAEFLLEHGARIDIFAAAMLGMTDVVAAFVAAQPGVQRTLGPHGIPLLAHATVGGANAEKTLAYLKGLGDAGQGNKIAPLEVARKPYYLGEYAVENGSERFEIKQTKSGQLTIDIKVDAEPISRWINYLGDDEFYPSGVPSVRLRFDVRDGKAQAFTINEDKVVLSAKRVSG
jgi:hypothetical protein